MPIPCKLHLSRTVLFALLVMPLSVLWVSVAHGQSPDPGPIIPRTLAYDEKEAQRIDGLLMCPVCPAETIDQAQVEVSRQMRRLVREKLSQGASRQEILDFFADRYGTSILAAPPKSGVNLVAWVVPVVGVLGAFAAIILIIRSMTRQGAREAVNEAAKDDSLIPYLDIIDRNLGLGEHGLAGQPGESENRQAPNIVAGIGSEGGTESVVGTEPEAATGGPESSSQDGE